MPYRICVVPSVRNMILILTQTREAEPVLIALHKNFRLRFRILPDLVRTMQSRPNSMQFFSNALSLYATLYTWINISHRIDFITPNYTEKTVSLIYGQRKNFFELKKVLLIQKNVLWSKKIDLLTLKKFFFESTKLSSIQRIFFFDLESKKHFFDIQSKKKFLWIKECFFN